MAWGQTHLPPDVLAALSATVEGIMALYRLMATGELGLARTASPSIEAATEQSLKKMMEDPRLLAGTQPSLHRSHGGRI